MKKKKVMPAKRVESLFAEDAKGTVLPPKSTKHPELLTEQGLTIQELRDIIPLCRQHGVLSLSFRGLSVSFAQSDADQTVSGPRLPKNAAATAEELEAARQRLADIQAHEGDEDAMRQVENRELYLENLKITDPLAYEQAVLEGGVE